MRAKELRAVSLGVRRLQHRQHLATEHPSSAPARAARKSSGLLIQPVTHRARIPPPGTIMCTCGWCVIAEPHVCSTDVKPILHAQPLGIGRNRQQGLRRRLEQQVVDHRLVVVSDGPDPRRQREHDVEVRHLQQLRLARLHPLAGLRSPGTWGNACYGSCCRQLPCGHTRGSRSAQRAHRGPPCGSPRSRSSPIICAWLRRPLVGVTPNGAVIAEDIRDLQTGTGHSRRRLQRRALAWPKRRKQIERARHIAQDLACDACVARRRVQLGMSQ